MTEDLKKLIDVAKQIAPTPEHREQQRRSFAYGNAALENSRITREMVDWQAEALARETEDRHQAPKRDCRNKPGGGD